jgi:hypothetical protein
MDMPHAWKLFPVIAFLALPFGVRGQTYDELSAMVAGPWHHVPNAVSSLQLNKDQAKCNVVAAQTPINSTTTSVVERVRWTVFVNCLKASGYEPGGAPTKTSTPSNDGNSKLAAQRWDDYTCAEIARLRKTSPNVDVLFFTWARGFIGGWNAATEKPILKVDPTAMPQDEQLKFIRSYCDGNPSKLYLAAVMELLAKLKYEKTKATGKAEED